MGCVTNMNTFVVIAALVGCALAQAPVQVPDSPEVAAAKVHFFAQYNAAAHAAAVAPDGPHEDAPAHPYQGFPYYGYPYAYGFPYGFPFVPHDTPEVYAAKVKHFAALHKAAAAAAAAPDTRKKRSADPGYLAYPYHGYPYLAYGHGYPYGYPYVPHDTPAVHAAKLAHFAAYNKAAAAAAAAPDTR